MYTNCFLFWHSGQFMYTTCSELVIFKYWACNSMNNFLSYCGLVDARISASEKDLPVHVRYEVQLKYCFWVCFLLRWGDWGECWRVHWDYIRSPLVVHWRVRSVGGFVRGSVPEFIGVYWGYFRSPLGVRWRVWSVREFFGWSVGGWISTYGEQFSQDRLLIGTKNAMMKPTRILLSG